MLDKSLFVSTEIVEREVEFANGFKQKLYFKELTDEKVRPFFVRLGADEAKARYEIIAESLCDSNGAFVASVDDVKKLKAIVINTLIGVISEVNGIGGETKKG